MSERMTLAHVANALARYEKDMRRDGVLLPPDYVRLREFILACAKGGTDAETEPVAMPSHPVLTKREAAAALRVSVRTVDRLIARGDLPAVKVSGATRILRQTPLSKHDRPT